MYFYLSSLPRHQHTALAAHQTLRALSTLVVCNQRNKRMKRYSQDGCVMQYVKPTKSSITAMQITIPRWQVPLQASYSTNDTCPWLMLGIVEPIATTRRWACNRSVQVATRHNNHSLPEDQDTINHYLGEQYQIAIELFKRDVEVDDLILLCTDGLWHMLSDEQIQKILALGGDTQMLAHTLVEAANTAGGTGNISAIVVRVQ